MLSVLPIIIAAVFVIALIIWALSRVSRSGGSHFYEGPWNDSGTFYSPTEPFTDLHHDHHHHDLAPGFGTGDSGGSDHGVPDFGGPDFGGPDLGGSDFGGSDFGGFDFGGSDFGGGDFGGDGGGGGSD